MKKISRKKESLSPVWPLWLAGTGLVLFLGAAFTLAWQIEIDYFDSFNFIMQTRRLFDSELYRAVAYDTSRPRMLVILLSLWHAPVKWISGSFPGITSIHLFMVCVTAGFLGAWTYFAYRYFGKLTAAFLLLLLVTQPLLLHYSYPAMTDLVSGAFLVLYLLAVHAVITERQQKGMTLHSALLLGASGAALALTKHHLVPVLPATLVLFPFLPLKSPRSPKQLSPFKWYGGSLLTYAVIVDLATRLFGKWGEGVFPHYKHIVKQALASRAEPTTPWLYFEALTQHLSSYPWYAGAAVLVVSFPFLRKEIAARSAGERIFLFVAASIVVGAITLMQATPHREVRYLLPFLPALLLPFAWSAARIAEGLPPRRYSAIEKPLLALFVLAFYFPVKGAVAEFKRFRAEPIYRSHYSGEKAFWEGVSSMGCRRVFACDFAVQAPRPWEFANDDYYRKHDLGPHYFFYLGVPSKYGPCPSSLLRDYGELARFWTPNPEPESCYAMPIPMVGGVTAMLVQTKCKLSPKTTQISCADKRVYPFTLQ